MAASKGPLDGLIVLDMSRILAGPTCTQLFGDLGATVIKIEHHERGDDTRSWGPPFVADKDGKNTDLSSYFMSANRNKLSVTVDIATPEGQQTIHRIAERADVVVENFKPGGLVKYGLDPATLRATHKQLVICSISGFGQSGPNSEKPGYDLMAQGFSGMMALTGPTEGGPTKVAVGIADVMCGMYAAVGVLAALRHRDATGEGQLIDLALVDSAMAWTINEGVAHLTTGKPRPRRGDQHPTIVPYQTFTCSDGYVLVAVGNDSQYKRFCDVLGRSDLANDPRYVSNPQRLAHRETLIPILADILATWSRDVLVAELETNGVPAGPVQTLEEAFASDQAKARDMSIAMDKDDTKDDAVALIGNPLKFSATPVTYRRPPPHLGEDTHAVLQWLDDKRAIPEG
ncbi:MAG: CoA transferase [Pseudomonadota bacterium]